MNWGSQEVKKKMESMLASFRREKAKGKKQLEPVKVSYYIYKTVEVPETICIYYFKGRREIYISTWFAFTRMAFLLDRDEPVQTICSQAEVSILFLTNVILLHFNFYLLKK